MKAMKRHSPDYKPEKSRRHSLSTKIEASSRAVLDDVSCRDVIDSDMAAYFGAEPV